MRTVVQRVRGASVAVEGRPVAEIGRGLLVFVGFRAGEEEGAADWMAEKIRSLRVFADGSGRMNRSVEEIEGELLIVSQFTLYADLSRGRRPSFVGAAKPEVAEPLYQRFLDACRGGSVPVASGEFGAHMTVRLENDGPVTMVIER